MEKIPIELKQVICENKLIVFVGAGLSFNLLNINNQPLMGWSNLVEKISEHLKAEGYDADHLFPLITKYEPIKVLELIELNKNFPKKEIYEFVKDFFDLTPSNDFSIHKKIFALCNKIITTNYDTAFEIAEPSLRKYKAYKGKNYELTTHKDANAKLLFKLHGCFEAGDSMVLFPSNYKNLYNNSEKDAEHSLLVLKNIVYNNSLLFIGTGMGDFQINSIFKEIKRLQAEYNQRHFIITNKALDSSLDFLTPILFKDYDEIKEIINELYKIKKECCNKEDEEKNKLKNERDQALKKIEELQKIANPSKDKLLERESLKYFSRGVEYTLSENYLDAINEYETSIELKPHFHEGFNNWGNALWNLAQAKSGDEAETLYQQAFEKYAKATAIKSDFHEAFYNWGTHLGDLAQAKSGDEAETLYQQAFEKYAKATEIKPDFHKAFYNWGNNLVNLAQTKSGDEAESLYQQSFEKHEKATKIKPDFHKAFYNWGTHLGNLAQTKSGEEADSLYHKAFEKYAKAIEIKFDKHEAFYNWGTSLLNLAQTKSGDEAESLYKQALEKFARAISFGGNCYNLGCLFAIRGNKANALQYLKLSLERAEISAHYVLGDKDWKSLWRDEDFKSLIEKYKK